VVSILPNFMTEHKIPSALLAAPRKAWIHRATSGEAKDCLLFLDGELYTECVKAPAILREAEAAGALLPVTCVLSAECERGGATCGLHLQRGLRGLPGARDAAVDRARGGAV
jgi:hypothetical protein